MATPGQELYDTGWRQGSRIPASVPQVHCTSMAGDTQQEPMPDGMDLVLTTQDCDLVKPADRLPFLEAIGCVDDSDRARSTRPNDGRFFVLNPETGVVADRAYGAFLTRETLATVPTPAHPFQGDPQRGRRFATWLGARFDRPALPTPAVESFQRPLVEALGRLCSRGKRHEALNRDLHEVRVIADLEDGPPFMIDLLIFVIAEKASEEAAELAVAEVLEEAGYAIEGVSSENDATAAVTVRGWLVIRPSQLSVALYQEAIPVPLAFMSVDGGEVIGAEPLGAESA